MIRSRRPPELVRHAQQAPGRRRVAEHTSPRKQALQQGCTSLATAAHPNDHTSSAHFEDHREEVDMTIACKTAEVRVARLIEETNRRHRETAVTTWVYELTTEIHNIGIVVGETSRTLLVNPCWLRFVIEAGDFKACVADEITAWYLIEALTSS
jgi:hypothetical protein